MIKKLRIILSHTLMDITLSSNNFYRDSFLMRIQYLYRFVSWLLEGTAKLEKTNANLFWIWRTVRVSRCINIGEISGTLDPLTKIVILHCILSTQYINIPPDGRCKLDKYNLIFLFESLLFSHYLFFCFVFQDPTEKEDSVSESDDEEEEESKLLNIWKKIGKIGDSNITR